MTLLSLIKKKTILLLQKITKLKAGVYAVEVLYWRCFFVHHFISFTRKPQVKKIEDPSMLASSMALIQQFSMPIARLISPSRRTRLRSYTIAAVAPSSVRDVSVPSSTSQVLLGLSEKELQQVALDLGQVKDLHFSILTCFNCETVM